MYQYDVTIVGGGLVGGSLACALANTGLRVALIEAVSQQSRARPSYDERVIALSLGSQRIFEAIGVWPEMAPEAEPILKVRVSDRGHCAFTRLDHAEEGVEALGYVIPARAMGAAIQTALKYAGNLEIFCPAQLLTHRVGADGVELNLLADGESVSLRTRLLVAADGGQSGIRAGLDLQVREHAYGQDAIITTVTPDRPLRGVAFERFTDTGPLAMLPMTAGRYSVVWTCRDSETADLLMLSDQDFLDRLQARFGFRLGRLGQVASRRAYPLKFVLTRDSVQDRLVMIGNSAHTLHPVAGQGFNLGLRDVAGLAEVLADCAAAGGDPGATETLAGYRRWRGRDQMATAGMTDALARLFVPDWTPLIMARAAGMLAVDLIPPARHLLAKRFMGLGGRQPRLACGLSLDGGRS